MLGTDNSAPSLLFGGFAAAFPKFAGRDGFAADCQHSHLVTGFLSLGESPFDTPRRSPEISHQLASVPRRQSPRDMCLRVEWGPLALSLYRPVSGVTV